MVLRASIKMYVQSQPGIICTDAHFVEAICPGISALTERMCGALGAAAAARTQSHRDRRGLRRDRLCLLAASAKAKVTLVKANRMGGDCLNFGCVPAKALIKSARVAQQMRHENLYGL